MPLTPYERTLRARYAASTRWANITDRRAALEPARKGLAASFYRGTEHLPADVADRIATSRRKAHYAKMHLASLRARQRDAS